MWAVQHVTVVLDRWPSTESELEGLITALRLEFTVQAEKKRNGEPTLKSLHYRDLAALSA